MATSNEKVVADSSGIFPTFEASYRKEANVTPEEIRVRLDYTHGSYPLDSGAYAVAWIMDFSGSMKYEVKLGVDGAADVGKFNEERDEKEQEPPKHLRRIDDAKRHFEEWLNSVEKRTKEQVIYLAVIKFSDEATCVTKGFEKLTADNIPQIIEKVNALEIGGGTQMSKGFDCLWEQETKLLKTLEEQEKTHSQLRPVRLEIHVSSDGAVFDAEEVIESVERAQYRMENAYSESDHVEEELALFLFFELKAYDFAGDANAAKFFKDLIKATSGTLITSWEQTKLIGSVYEEENGSNFKNTLTLQIPEESRCKASIPLQQLRKKNIPDGWTLVKDNCTDESCTFILPKAEEGTSKGITIHISLTTALDRPEESFPFLDACLKTKYGHSRQKVMFQTALKLRLTIRRVENADDSDPEAVQAGCKRNDAKSLFSELSEDLRNSESEDVRIAAQNSLDEFRQSISEDLMKFGEIRTIVDLIVLAQKELDKPASKVSNEQGSRLLYMMQTSVDTLELPRELAAKLPKGRISQNDKEGGNVAFDVRKDENQSNKGLQIVRKGKSVRSTLSNLVRSSVRSRNRSTPILTGLEDPALQVVTRISMRRRIYTTIMGEEREREHQMHMKDEMGGGNN